MNGNRDTNGWDEYRKLFQEQTETLKQLQEQVTRCRIEIASLKAKSRMWGFIAGLIPSALIALYTWVHGGK